MRGEDIKIPAWGRKQGARQKKREVDIFRPASIITFHQSHRKNTRQSEKWEKGEETKRVNKEISTAFKNPLQPNACQDHNAFWMRETWSPGKYNQRLHHKMREER